MPLFVATYDVQSGAPDPHTPVIKALVDEKWSRWIEAGDKLYLLPNTCVVGTFATKDLAVQSFDKAVAAASKALGQVVTVEKLFVIQYAAGSIRSDKSKKAG